MNALHDKRKTALEYCSNFRKSHLEQLGKAPEEIHLTPEYVNELLSSQMFLKSLPKPTAPVKATKEVATPRGLFFKSMLTERFVEYDHHAPDYLKALDKWEKSSAQFEKINPNGMILGMKIIIKGEK